MSDSEHDHSGDRLGVDAPVESIRVNSVTIDRLVSPSSYLVYRRDGRWFGLRTDTQDVAFADDDGAVVINAALAELGDAGDGPGGGVVRVTSDATGSGTTLTTDTSIRHTTDRSTLILEAGVTLRYTGDAEAITVAGDRIGLDFAEVRSSGDYGIRDLGLSNASIRAGAMVGSADTLWFSDAVNQVHVPPADSGATDIFISWGVPAGDFSIRMTSAPDARFTDYRFITPILFGPLGVLTDTPPEEQAAVVLGDESDAQSVHHTLFYGDLDGGGGPRVIVNDSHNTVFLKDYIPGAGSDGDVIVRPSAEDTCVYPVCVRGHPSALVVQREALRTTDLTKFDKFRPEIMSFDLMPDSLDAFERIERDGGTVDLYSGYVEQRTGDDPGSWANLRRHVSQNYGRLLFSNSWVVLQTNLWVSDNADQEAWLLWGDREGPGVGWHIVDDVLEGIVQNGDETHTVPLRTGFEAGTSWNLTTLYNLHVNVHYYVNETQTGDISTTAPDEPVRARADATYDTLGGDESAGSLSIQFPEDDDPTVVHQVMSMDLTNTGAGEKAMRWSNWRNYQYPRF